MTKGIELQPMLFMSANWFPLKQMQKLFVAGLLSGIRGFDTAREYRKEELVGKALAAALKETGISREEVFIQSRISNEELIKGKIKDEVYRSLDKMNLEYFDSFMFHWPTPDYYIDAWRKLESVYTTDNVLKSIGLCNVRQRHFDKMIENKVDMLPQIVQIEVTPFWQVKELKSFCDKNKISIQAFSPLCKMIEPIRSNQLLNDLAIKHGVSIPQLILKWHLQRGIYPITMSSKVEHVRNNSVLNSFCLESSEMNELASLDCGYKYHLESSTCYGF